MFVILILTGSLKVPARKIWAVPPARAVLGSGGTPVDVCQSREVALVKTEI
jgi:hypothetical protein